MRPPKQRKTFKSAPRFVLMVLAMLSLLGGHWAGLLRLGWDGPELRSWGGWLNASAIDLFLIATAYSILSRGDKPVVHPEQSEASQEHASEHVTLDLTN